MNAVTVHQRPGVYSAYEISSVIRSGSRSGVAALAAVSIGGKAGELYSLTSYSQAVEAFGQGDGMTLLTKLLLANGAARVLAVPVKSGGSYDAAFSLLASQEGVKVMVCDSEDLTVHQALREVVEESAGLRRERIAVVPVAGGESVAQLLQRAKNLNSERMVLAAPPAQGDELSGAQVAAAVAGAICGQADPAIPLGEIIKYLDEINNSSAEVETVIIKKNKLIGKISSEFENIVKEMLSIFEISDENLIRIKDIQGSIKEENQFIHSLNDKMKYVADLSVKLQ